MMRNLSVFLLLGFCILFVKGQDFSFVFFTDVHMNQSEVAGQVFTKMVKQVNSISPEFAIQGGDFIFDMNHEEWDSILPSINRYNKIISELNCPVYNTLGNHDVAGITKLSTMQPSDPNFNKAYFLESNTNSYYNFSYNGIHFFVLDCIQHTKNHFSDYYIDTIQQEWITKKLEEIEASEPIVIVSHVPFLSTVAQIKSGGLARNSKRVVLSNGKDVVDLFKGYNPKLFLAGHVHVYEKIEIEEITYVIGGAVSGFWWKGPMGKTEQGFVVVKVSANNKFSVEYQAIR